MTQSLADPCPVCVRRPPRRAQVCDACRSRTRHQLTAIPDLLADLDPQGAGAIRVNVTGSPTAPVPVNLAVLDVLAPARPGSLGPYTRALAGADHDQTGPLSTATLLDHWARDWAAHRAVGEHLPVPTVPVLTGWLRTRLDDACDDHPAIAEFAVDIHEHHRLLHVMGGDLDLPEYKGGIPCRRCDTVGSLYHQNGSDWIECSVCPDLVSPAEYDRWIGLLAANERGKARHGS